MQPALTEAGLSALWTPRLISRLGYCEFNCNLCGQVCPTGAIPKLALAEKQQQVLGTAYFDRNRCIPFVTPHNCTVCEEHCPTGDKAIKLREAAPPFWPPDRPGNTLSGNGTGEESESGSGVGGESEAEAYGAQAGRDSQAGAEPNAAPGFQAAGGVQAGGGEQAAGGSQAAGGRVTTLQPYVDPPLCIGCGICEKVCPVPGVAAVRALRAPPGSAYSPGGESPAEG